MSIRAGAAAAAVLVLAASAHAACGSDDDLVSRYCRYGAVSEAQLQGCVEHVSPADVQERQTHASQYAYGDLRECLADSGPYCTPD